MFRAIIVGLSLLIGLATAQAQDSAAPTEAPVAPDISRIAKSIVRIESTISADIKASGTGFLLDQRGLIVTNFHVLRDASEAIATTSDGTKVSVTPVAWSEALDLALLQPVKPDALTKSLYFLELRTTEPQLGEEVWALGHPAGMSLTVNRGIVSAVRRFSELPERVRKFSSLDRDSLWIQTDCPINPGNSGGPLVDREGRVVGVNTWSWSSQQDANFAVHTNHVRTLLDQPRSEEGDFAAFRSKGGRTPRTSVTLPHLAIERNQRLQVAARLANSLDHEVRCIGCRGTGQVKERVQTGNTGGSMPRPIFSVETRACRSCEGTGLSKSERIDRAFSRLVDSISRGVPTENNDFLKRISQSVAAEFKGSPPGLSQHLNSRFASESNSGSTVVGTPMFAVGSYVRDAELPIATGGQQRLRVVTVGNHIVLVANPTIAEVVPGQRVFVAGLFAGNLVVEFSTPDSDEKEALPIEPIVVLQNGCLIATP